MFISERFFTAFQVRAHYHSQRRGIATREELELPTHRSLCRFWVLTALPGTSGQRIEGVPNAGRRLALQEIGPL